MDYSKVLDSLKLTPRVLLGVALGTGFLIVAPVRLVTTLGMSALLTSYRGWIGGAFVISSALLLGHGVSAISAFIARRWTEHLKLKRMQRALEKLSPPEQAVLAEYFTNGTTTRHFEISDGIVNGLVVKRILYRSSNIASYFTAFPFNVQPWVWEYLREHPSLIDAADVRDDD